MFSRLERRIRTAALIIALALLLELASIFWHHPLSLLILHMLALGGVVLGVAMYLLSLVRSTPPPEA
jgi:hypothetical protein